MISSIFENIIFPKTPETIYPQLKTKKKVNKKPITQLIFEEPGISGKNILIIDCAGPAKKVKITLINHKVATIGKIENKPIRK